jgi:uncharacterized protein (DUF58 family)
VTGLPTARGWSVAVLAVTALGLGAAWRYPGLAAAGAALALLLVASLGSVARPGRLGVRRVVAPLQVPRFGDCTATLTVTHTGGWLPALVDGVEPVGDSSVAVAAAWLRPGERVERDYRVPTGRRGKLRVGPLRLRRYGLAGLAARTELAGGGVSVRVLPRVLPVRAIPPGVRRGHASADERVAHGGTDLIGLREYLPGDDLRRLHWGTTARTGKLMVREDADPSHAHLAVVLDDRAGSYRTAGEDAAGEDPGAGPGVRFEEAVDAAASLAGAASGTGHPVKLRSMSARLDVEVSGGPGPGHGRGRPAPELLAALAEVTLAEVTLAEPARDAGTGVTPPVPAAPRDLDVLVLISGGGADLTALVLEAGRAAVGVVLVIDPEPAAPVRASGSVLVLSAPSAELLLGHWDGTVAGSGRQGVAGR